MSWNVSIKSSACAGGAGGRLTPWVRMGSLGILLLPPTIQRHTREAIANPYLTIGVSASGCLSP